MQCSEMPDTTYSAAARALLLLESFSQGRFKYRENWGSTRSELRRCCSGTFAFTEDLLRNAKKCRHIFHSFNLHTDAKSRAAHIFGCFRPFWNLCSLSFSIQIGRTWWMDPNARAMAKKLRRFVSDLWFIQNTHVQNKYSKNYAEFKYISRFHLWYRINCKRYVLKNTNWHSCLIGWSVPSFSHFEFDALKIKSIPLF